MKFLSAHIENFLTVSGANVQLADKGLHLIQGNNKDDDSASSNGAGKSSIVDALCWCLFGVTAREVKGDAVVNRTVKKNTAVTVLMQNGASVYKVTRYRKHHAGKNSLTLSLEPATPGDAPVALTRGTDSETQKELEKILGCSYEVFVAAVYSGQEAMPDLPKMGDRELKQLIEEGAGLQRIERAYRLSRDRLNLAKSALDSHASRLDQARTAQVRTETALQQRRVAAAAWAANRATVIASHEARVATAKADATTKALAAQKLKTPADEAAARLAVITVELSKHAELQRAARSAADAQRQAENAIEKHALSAAKAKVEQITAQIANAATELSKPCAECGTPGSLDKMDEWVEHKNTHLEKARADWEALKTRVMVQLQANLKAKKAAEEAQAAVPDVTVLEQERTRLNGAVTDFQNALRAAQVAKNTYDQENLTLANQKSAVNPDQLVVDDLEKRLADETAQIAALQTEVDAALQKVMVSDSVVKVFGPAGVRAQILDTVTPFLNARTADYLSVLSDGAMQAIWTTLTKTATGDLKEKFSIEVTHSKGADSFAGLSGGEKRKVRLACALALQDLVASRATQPIDLWIGDEVDDALDPSGLERLMTILERKARERGTVMVISHSDLRDWIDNVTTVTKEGGVSLVEGSLCA